jgi:hypothetical protein
MKRNMEFRILANLGLFVVFYGPDDPTNAEWLEYLASVERWGLTTAAQLVVSDGGAPNRIQLRYLSDILRGQSARVAVVSTKLRVRAVVTVVSAFNSDIKAFTADEFPEVLDHLRIARSERAVVEDALLVLRTNLRAA